MKYLVTGGAGFIGSHIVERLINRGDSVVVLDDLSTGCQDNFSDFRDDLEFIIGSILDESLVENLVSKVDHVFHYAAAVGVFNIIDNPLQSLHTNLNGTEILLRATSKHARPFLLASTSEIYGKNSSDALNETSDRVIGSPLLSRWSYSEAKALDETLTFLHHKEFGTPVRILRYFNTVGPRQTGNYGMVIPGFVKAAIEGSPIKIYGDGTQTRCFCHVSDAVDATLRICDTENTIGEVYNVGNNYEISILDLAKQIIEVTNSKSEIQFVSYKEAYGPGFEDMQKRVPNIGKIKRAVNWTPKLTLLQIIQDIAESLSK